MRLAEFVAKASEASSFATVQYFYFQLSEIQKHTKYAIYGRFCFSLWFQSDGKRTYMNQCAFIGKKENNKEKLTHDFAKLSDSLKQYGLQKAGEDYLTGGVSPLWDGNWRHWKEDFAPAIGLAIFKENGKYNISLIYGHPLRPFNYVEDKF